MSRHQVAITPNTPGVGCHRIEMDGHDISRGVHKATLWLEPGCLPQLDLELRLLEEPRIRSAEVDVTIPDATREVLVRLGWAPPIDGGH